MKNVSNDCTKGKLWSFLKHTDHLRTNPCFEKWKVVDQNIKLLTRSDRSLGLCEQPSSPYWSYVDKAK